MLTGPGSRSSPHPIQGLSNPLDRPLPTLHIQQSPALLSLPLQGILTVKDMVLVNLPNSPSQYPAGLLSCMPWFLDPSRCEGRAEG